MKSKNMKTGMPFFLFIFFVATVLTQNAYCAKNLKVEKATEKWVAEDQFEAIKKATEVLPFVAEVIEECPLIRQQRLRNLDLSIKDIDTSYFLLDSPIINKTDNHYTPVRFMHSRHAASVGDCSACHHYRPADKGALETTRCSACHQDSFKQDYPERIGLKAAYHLQCMGCHQKEAKGPVECTGCHSKNTTDHTTLVRLEPNAGPTDVTKECLRCHDDAGEEMLKTVHWQWEGDSPYTLCKKNEIKHGKKSTALNNY